MIYLITGTPGAGKSLYAISNLVQSLVNTKLVKRGKVIDRRLLVDGVKGLILPHEMLTPGIEDDELNFLPADEGCGVWNWYEWCKPGDVIFVDEVQRWFRPRGMGTKPPPAIKHLETHRHLGIDFVFVTQNPMLLDQNIRRLVFRHQHIRRLFGLQRAVIYEWDACAAEPSRTKSSSMSFWSYPRKAYDLYVSSELHTKPKVKVPAWVALPVAACIGAVLVAPTAFGVMSGAMSGKGIASAAKTAPGPEKPASAALASASPSAAPAAVPSGSDERSDGKTEDRPQVAGCIASPARGCRCFDREGRKVPTDEDLCPDPNLTKPVAAADIPAPELARAPSPADMELYAFVHNQRGPRNAE